MKSRISFFNKTVFRKNFTRFAPAWGLFTLWMCISVSVFFEQAGSSLLAFGQGHSIYAFLFAPLCAQLLFGDLYNTRMCNALHALPLRRETWFGTNVVSGFVFFLIPAVCSAALAGLMLGLGGYEGNMAVVPLYLITITLQYIFFWGIAVFSIFFAGSRFAHATVYLLLNFGSLIVQWLVSSLYTPMFYGLKTNPEPFRLFSPVVTLADSPFFTVETIQRYVNDSEWDYRIVDTKNILPGDGFVYYFLAAAAGILLLLGALQLYRRRKLECAGDFLAIRSLGPVFSLIFTLTLGAFFHEISGGLLLLGLAVGWFTSQMMLERTVRVFKKKTFLRFGVLTGVFLLTLGITALDPLGLEKWVPEEDEVQSVTIYEGHYQYSGKESILKLEKPEDIAALIDIHQDCLDYYYENTDNFTRIALVDIVVDTRDSETIPLVLSYRLKNGLTVNRYYYVPVEDSLDQLKLWLNTPEAVFGKALTEEEFLAENLSVTIRADNSAYKWTVTGEEDLRELYRAILADCEEGRIPQELSYDLGLNRNYILEFSSGLRIQSYSISRNTTQWINQHR